MKFKISSALLFISAVISLASTSAFAGPIFSSTSAIFPALGNLETKSYDGPGFNGVGHVGAVSTLNFLELSNFDATPTGVDYEMYFLSSVAAYKDQNEFGLMNDKGDFVSSVKGSSALGSKSTYSQAPSENLKFAFRSPESTFFSDPTENADGALHMLALQASKDALVTIPQADLQGNSMAFNLLAGDFVFFLEDMLSTSGFRGLPGADFDFNDFLVVVRAKRAEVPEPATLFLLTSAGLLFIRRSYHH